MKPTCKSEAEAGFELTMTAGHALVLPAGTGHKKLRFSADFWIIGAYPQGQRAADGKQSDTVCESDAPSSGEGSLGPARPHDR